MAEVCSETRAARAVLDQMACSVWQMACVFWRVVGRGLQYLSICTVINRTPLLTIARYQLLADEKGTAVHCVRWPMCVPWAEMSVTTMDVGTIRTSEGTRHRA